MAAKIVIDSNIFIYALIDNHPAHLDCKQFLIDLEETNPLYSSAEVLGEIYYVLSKFYCIPGEEIISHLNGLLESNIRFIGSSSERYQRATGISAQFKIDLNDCILFRLSQELEAPIIITDDNKFSKFLQKKGMIVRTPITEQTRKEMEIWEKEHKPPKGFPRILQNIYDYLHSINPQIATGFKMDTNSFMTLPLLPPS